MAKQALGRSLGTLLDNTAKEAEKAPVSAGVRTLMRGNQPAVSGPPASVPAPAIAAAPVKPVQSHKTSAMPVWYLFAADILLAAISLGIVFGSPHPISWQRALFCSIATLLGALLAIAAVMISDR